MDPTPDLPLFAARRRTPRAANGAANAARSVDDPTGDRATDPRVDEPPRQAGNGEPAPNGGGARVRARRASPHRTEVATIWPVADARSDVAATTCAPVAVHPEHGSAFLCADGRVESAAAGSHADADRESVDARTVGRRVAAIFVFAGRSYLRVHDAGTRVLRNGRPVVGGLAPLQHGDWLTVAGGRGVHRFWLSAEGRRRLTTAAAAGTDTMTLADIRPGERVVACPCGATYLPSTWTQLRRCCRCGAVEDGGLRELPPGWVAPATPESFHGGGSR